METQSNHLHTFNFVRLILLALTTLYWGCAPTVPNTSAESADARIVASHEELRIENVASSSASSPSSAESSDATKDIKKNSSLTIGSIYLEAQLKPLSVNGLSLQASDIFAKGDQIYIAYSAIDANGVVVKRGAIENLKTYACDNFMSFLVTEFCIKSMAKLEFPNTDLFGVTSDGTNLWAVGSTSDESALPHFARLYKIGLDSGKPTAITGTAVLPSYAGTGVVSLGSSVLATSGTSTDSNKMGGLSVVNANTMAVSTTKSLYDARGVGVYGSNPTTAFVTRGKVDNSNLGALLEFNANGSGNALRTINSGGNTIAESKSNVIVGNTLLLASMGDQGFKVICKATGSAVLTVNAINVPGISSSKTVTNSVIAIPGYIFAANGEAGIYIYRFTKSNVLNSSYCQGVTATLIGRLALDSDNSDSTYVNAELSANSLHYLPILNISNILTTKLVVVASGNKGVSLINVTTLNLMGNGIDVDDF